MPFQSSKKSKHSSIQLPLHLSCSFASSLSSPPLGLLGHGPAQRSGRFGELHVSWFDGWQLSGDLLDVPLVWALSIGSTGKDEVLRGVWSAATQPDAEVHWFEDWKGEGVSFGKQLVFSHASLQSAHSPHSGWAGLGEGASLPVSGHGLPPRIVKHCRGLAVLVLCFHVDAVPVSSVALSLNGVLLSHTAAQLGSHHAATTLLQDCANLHLQPVCVCYSKVQFTDSRGSTLIFS